MMSRASLSLIAVLLVSLLLNGAAFSQGAQTVLYVPTIVEAATTCKNVSFEIWIKNVQDLTAFHLEMRYDPESVEIISVAAGTVLGAPTEPVLYEPVNWPKNPSGQIWFGLTQEGTNGNPLPKDVGEEGGVLLRITLRPKKTGDSVPFTIDIENSVLVNWPDVMSIPFSATNPGVIHVGACSVLHLPIIFR